MKAVILLAVLAVAAARPEAPLSPKYGPPSHHNGNGHRNGNGNGHRNGNGNGISNGNGNGISNGNGNGISNGNGNGNGFGQAPELGAPAAANGGAPIADIGIPSDEFVAPGPAANGARSNGAHSNGRRNGGNGNGRRNGAHSNGGFSNGGSNGALSVKYGPPGYQSAAPISAGDPLAEPASYKFSYKVEDAEAGLDFGHEEEREGDDTKGEYTVLLPDGRNMIVTYTADLDGYKPEIKFEEAKGGYSRGPQNGY